MSAPLTITAPLFLVAAAATGTAVVTTARGTVKRTRGASRAFRLGSDGCRTAGRTIDGTRWTVVAAVRTTCARRSTASRVSGYGLSLGGTRSQASHQAEQGEKEKRNRFRGGHGIFSVVGMRDHARRDTRRTQKTTGARTRQLTTETVAEIEQKCLSTHSRGVFSQVGSGSECRKRIWRRKDDAQDYHVRNHRGRQGLGDVGQQYLAVATRTAWAGWFRGCGCRPGFGRCFLWTKWASGSR